MAPPSGSTGTLHTHSKFPIRYPKKISFQITSTNRNSWELMWIRTPGSHSNPTKSDPLGVASFFCLLKFFFCFFLKFIYLFYFMAVLGLRFCARAFSSCGKRGPLFIAVRGPLTIAASLVAEHRLQTRRLSNCGSRAQLLRGMWDLPRPGLEPVSPALAGGLSTTAPPGKPFCLLKESSPRDFYVPHALDQDLEMSINFS